MAQQAGTRNRPLSPHLQIWRWGPGMLSSILHRATGIAASVGIFVLLWWLGALVAGPAAYAKFVDLADSPLGILILLGISYSVIAHGITGIRHFVLDTGAGYELDTNKRWATICTALGVILTAVFWAALLLR
ncbi:succinate dehydrogenase / fumarate reductase cytochrome b subunit [Novosphingobium chloroacetimidivorans]|uniref:Succinate dehydrogenase cytochrome b556 subunit n=1 Tax=Novosphingobium chloroacetimidivorans TaxID=1428314 RepID=A0A7W7KA01_9SPHN|nr:succinate dehydrogenase, cytochrome b556 subunit [Novosphingobium chloroacetimidivorans]MBB4858972.1 succinate dehydrogenase / fumarate reductase cytochrome b subunit [Novosphingobium chloroacetimidivorans]